MGDFRFEVWPTEYPVIIQHFGVNPRNYAQFGLPGHDGIDIQAPTGSKIFCVAPGEVFRIHEKPTGHNYGIHVRVAHQDGYQTVYAHLQKIFVRLGQIVEAGTILGLANETGNSFGPHLHLSLKKKGARVDNWPYEIIDPTPYLLPLLGWKKPAGPYVEGWLLTESIFIQDELAQVNEGGATLYVNPSKSKLVPSGTIIIVVSQKKPFTRVRIPLAAIGVDDKSAPKPAAEPPPIVSTVDGWGWKRFLTLAGKQAIVGPHGVNLRTRPDQTATNIGMVKANSTVSLIGMPKDLYVPIRVRRNDFQEPVDLPEPPPDPGTIPPRDGYMGWVLTQFLSTISKRRALTSRLGVNLRSKPDRSGQNIGLVKAFATVSLAGPPRGEYTPILIRKQDVLNAVVPMPDVDKPDPWPDGTPPDPAPKPDHDTTPGWSFTNGLYITGNQAKVARFGSNLREAPRRDADKVGFIPAGTTIIVTGPAQGEYTPVRVRDDLLQPPKDDDSVPDPDTQTMGRARLGLHASADPEINEAEQKEFIDLRPGMIKVLSFHGSEDVQLLATTHPEAHFVVRAFLSFGGRNISPGKFLEDTLTDVRRTLEQLRGRQVVVELHNEPNVVEEGLGSSWSDGATFSLWWRELLKRYRQALPGVRFIFPGLSMGTTVTGVKLDHIQFLEANRAAVEAADGIAVHVYWSDVVTMEQALDQIDDYISRFRSRSIWITEASRKGRGLPPQRLAQEYLRFWRELQTRPVVQGVTYFVASASNPDFANEVWVGKGIGRLLGKR